MDLSPPSPQRFPRKHGKNPKYAVLDVTHSNRKRDLGGRGGGASSGSHHTSHASSGRRHIRNNNHASYPNLGPLQHIKPGWPPSSHNADHPVYHQRACHSGGGGPALAATTPVTQAQAAVTSGTTITPATPTQAP
ncbi:hypothetical protein DPMN_175804 [Dreissena polymorpha]|uniref:Uncharacterized protein n=1 Tax=Dreissena polymorpha TaxID=45954 RepID=A0A9D4EA30_DREPO|nr:hypothetical protein DPMN_175804 [Dreissena polymorpha]